jgi:hypothetical protein
MGETNHIPPSSAEVKNACYTSTPQYAFIKWCSDKARGQFYLYIYFSVFKRLDGRGEVGSEFPDFNPLLYGS